MKNRGQAAMEFLMTYGWAILAAIIVIAVLAIYFKPSSLAPQNSVVSAPFYAPGSSITATTNNVLLEIQNNGGETLPQVNVTLTPKQPSSVTSCTGSSGSVYVVGPMVAGQRNVTSFTCAGLSTAGAGTSFQSDVTVQYQRPNSGIVLTSTGQLSGTAR